MKGVFIALEGIDGSGKSTQAALLAERLKAAGREVVLTREPGGTTLGQQLRQLLLSGSHAMAWETEMLLMAADRAEHVASVIKPALARNAVVICDRYVHSSLAYQGYGPGRPVDMVRAVNDIAMQGLWPDLVLLFALPPDSRYCRAGKADNFEMRASAYHQRVYEGYLHLAGQDPTIAVLEVKGKSVAEVAELVWQACLARFPELELGQGVN